MISLDTSGAMKLVRPEAHGGTVSRWFRNRPGIPVISSVPIEVELMHSTDMAKRSGQSGTCGRGASGHRRGHRIAIGGRQSRRVHQS